MPVRTLRLVQPGHARRRDRMDAPRAAVVRAVAEAAVISGLRRVVLADGACAQPGAAVPDMFPDPADPAAVAVATAACARCPVTGTCLLLGRAYGAEYGVWGGVLLTPAEPGQAEGGVA